MKRSDKSTTLITSALAGLLLMAVLAIYLSAGSGCRILVSSFQ